MFGTILYHSQGPNWPFQKCHIAQGAPTDPLSVEIYVQSIHSGWKGNPVSSQSIFILILAIKVLKPFQLLPNVCESELSTWVEIVIATQWVRRTGQGHKHFEDVFPFAEADQSLHLAHHLSHLHSRLLDHRPCQVLLFRRRPGPQHVRLSYN